MTNKIVAMNHTDADIQAQARTEAFSIPIDAIDPGIPDYFVNDTICHYFARLRRDDPVHHCNSAIWGPYWSVTRFEDIMHVDINHDVFSSDWSNGGITLFNSPAVEDRLQMFIAMDQPEHERQRSAVSPIFAPGNLAKMEGLIRARTCRVLDELPRNETFNWVEHVSIELTTLMLATLFDFPIEDRHLLAHWSDVFTSYKIADPNAPSDEEKRAEMERMLAYFQRLWAAKGKENPAHDLISMLAHNPETQNMSTRELMGNLVLLIVGGNDTTRHSMSGGLLALSENPTEWAKVSANPALIETLIPEIIRWQTPLAHMRRTTVKDVELRGKRIKAGEKVVMWYLSGNRDESAINDADRFIVDRARARQHLSFGFGIHRCLGNRLAEMQLRILWEEILTRFPLIEVMGTPVRLRSAFVRGFKELLVRIPA